MERTCNFNGYCTYRSLGNICYGCLYSGYCDYQTPRDSRDEGIYKVNDDFGQAMKEGD